MSVDIFKHLSNKMSEEIKIISDDLALGKAKDHGDYKYAVGMIRGLMVANSIIADMAERYEEIE